MRVPLLKAPIPGSGVLEDLYLPNKDTIIRAVKREM
jgi:hypothetical protein